MSLVIPIDITVYIDIENVLGAVEPGMAARVTFCHCQSGLF